MVVEKFKISKFLKYLQKMVIEKFENIKILKIFAKNGDRKMKRNGLRLRKECDQ